MIKKREDNYLKKRIFHEGDTYPSRRQYNGLSLRLLAIDSKDQFNGYAYKITNVSDSPINLAEDDLYLPGDTAIYMLDTHLEPGTSTEIYIVKTRPDEDDAALS